jgi:hypothetical protein
MEKQSNFDVFIAYSVRDKPQVRVVAAELKRRGLRCWIDEQEILPGQSIQDAISEAISNVRSIAIFIGSGGFGRWQALELKSLISQSIKLGIPVIPVLLPGVNQIPDEIAFLKEIHFVVFNQGIDDPQALNMLEWGITGQRPTQELKLTQPFPSEPFDIYLCFQTKDKLEVKKISEELKKCQIHPWPNQWEFNDEVPWQTLLTKQIEEIDILAVCVGNNGEPWEDEDIESFIWECIEAGCFVIPIVLRSAIRDPKFPIYLRRRRIVNFRDQNSNSILELVNLIRKGIAKEENSPHE